MVQAPSFQTAKNALASLSPVEKAMIRGGCVSAGRVLSRENVHGRNRIKGFASSRFLRAWMGRLPGLQNLNPYSRSSPADQSVGPYSFWWLQVRVPAWDGKHPSLSCPGGLWWTYSMEHLQCFTKPNQRARPKSANSQMGYSECYF